MTQKERAIMALNRQIPDYVPTFELEFQIENEMFGRPFYLPEEHWETIDTMSLKEKEEKIYRYAAFMVEVYTKLEYAIIPAYGPSSGSAMGNFFDEGGPLPVEHLLLHKYLREMVGDTVMLGYHGDGTFAIPDGDHMYEFVYAIADDPDGVKATADKMANMAIERNKKLQESGIDCLFLCSDYCYNTGPFISPEMFSEFVQPYLYRIIDAAKKDGLYTIKHTDGNIMPILDQLVECKPHALHSIDPMAGVDIKEVKRLVGDKVALCGNVHCAALQTGTDQEVIDSAEYCLTHAKPGGGYFFCTSNIPFKGMPVERYQMILDVWKRMRNY